MRSGGRASACGSVHVWLRTVVENERIVGGRPASRERQSLPGEGKAPISVLIPTRNEARNIVDCIESVAWAGEVVVLDSFSDDGTAALAERAGARVFQRSFDDYARNKNWALDNIDFAHQWILMLDADERATPDLAREVAAVIEEPDPHAGYYVPRQNWFDGVWLRYGGCYPDFNLRLLRRGRGRYEPRAVHEHVALDGSAGYLESPLVHLNDNKGMHRYLERHIRYAQMEAMEAHKLAVGVSSRQLLQGDLLVPGPTRRRALKNLAYRHLPARPLWVFLWMYLFKLGVLNGRVGLRYCLLRMMYEFQIDVFLGELRQEHPMASAEPRLQDQT